MNFSLLVARKFLVYSTHTGVKTSKINEMVTAGEYFLLFSHSGIHKPLKPSHNW
jgi:hypothetical protein